MSSSSEPEVGDVHRIERVFSHDDVERFGELSGDEQAIHSEPDEHGRLMVQGLLTATLPTAIGSKLEVLARTMEFEFHKPVYTGETVVCEVTTESVTERDDRYDITCAVVCRRDESVVLRGGFEGVIWKA